MYFWNRAQAALQAWRMPSVPALLLTSDGDDAQNVTYLTVRDVAALFKIHPETVRRLTREKMITAHSIGGQWRYQLEEVQEDARRWGEHRRAFYGRAWSDKRRAAAYKRKRR